MKLSGNAIYGFTNSLLLQRFDKPVRTPWFHKELWDICSSEDKYVAIAAPRGHAKSTAVTHAYHLAALLFKQHDFSLIISDTETQAIQFLGDVKRELIENEELMRLFDVKTLVKDAETDIIVRLGNNHEFRVLAKGSEQKLRGLKWRNKRPNLIICDDLENDEIVQNEERRAKFRNWFFQALVPSLSDEGKIRVVGTILHLDSLLERFMPQESDEDTVVEPLKIYSTNKDKVWKAIKYRAHPGLNEFDSILWSDKFSEARLKKIRQMYLDQGDAEGYSQEYLNNPIDDSTAYFVQEDFIPIKDKEEPLEYYSGVDLAISEKDRRAYTAMATAGINSKGVLKVVDVMRYRSADGYEHIDNLFKIHQRWNQPLITIEEENIARAIGPVLDKEQRERGIYLTLNKTPVSQDKLKRARSLQARMRAGMVEFDTGASWYPALYEEMRQFPKGRYSDQVDALAHVCLALDKMVDAPTKEELDEEAYEEDMAHTLTFNYSGRSAWTGY